MTSLKGPAAEIPEAYLLAVVNRENVFWLQTMVSQAKTPLKHHIISSACRLVSRGTVLTANRHRGAAVSLVNSFQLQEWISPNWISLCLSRQPIVTKRVDAPPSVGRPLPRKHCQSQVNAFLATLVPKSCQGNTCSPVSLSCESQWAQQPKAPCW